MAMRFDETTDAEGFRVWRLPETGRFVDSYGETRVRAEPHGRVRCRVAVGEPQANGGGAIHGGFILAYVDHVAFCGLALLGRLPPGGAVTLAANTSFISAGSIDEPLDAIVEVVGETGRMMFVRGLMEQSGRTVASFEVTLRKTPVRGAPAPAPAPAGA